MQPAAEPEHDAGDHAAGVDGVAVTDGIAKRAAQRQAGPLSTQLIGSGILTPNGVPGPDQDTLDTGDAGKRVACGVING